MEELDCLDHCSSLIHGKEICDIASASKNINALPLWIKKCANYAQVRDVFGRTALHIVASTGNIEALEWLVKRGGADIDKKDLISGYTALHRSIFSGQIHIARSLISFNADVNLRDNEGMNALDLCNADRPLPLACNVNSDPNELFVWGTNDNFTLGSSVQQARLVPEQLDVFRKNNISIMQVVLESYHSIFLTQDRVVYVSGNGRGGRLGTGFESTLLHPEPLQFQWNGKCIQIAAGSDHSLFLMENGRVLSCGSNEHGVLGQRQSVKLSLVPKSVELSGKPVDGILAGRFHSVFYNSINIFTCGGNRGQLGHGPEKGPVLYEPKLITQIALPSDGQNKFTHVAVNNFSTIARVSNGIVYVMHKFQCNKINAKNFDVVKLCVCGGGFDDSARFTPSSSPGVIGGTSNQNQNIDPLIIGMLTSSGKLILWRESTCSRAVFHCGRILHISDFCMSQSSLLLVTATGEAYKSIWKPQGRPQYIENWQQRHKHDVMLSQNDFQVSSGGRRLQKGREEASGSKIFLELVKIQKIKHVYSALSITCDGGGKNFAVIQASLKLDLTTLPEISAPMLNQHLMQFYSETSQQDSLHDVMIKVESSIFPAHRYIIGSHAPKLYEKILRSFKKQGNQNGSELDNTPLVSLTEEGFKSRSFEQILQFIYYESCELLTLGSKLRACSSSKAATAHDIIKETIDGARKLELSVLCKRLHHVELVDGVVRQKSGAGVLVQGVKGFAVESFKELADIHLKSQDGNVFKAHRCILVARSEYFHSMLFAHSWIEQDSKKPIPLQFSDAALKILLEYMYTDTISQLPTNDFDGLSEILAMADNFFMERLRTLIESALADLISLKNICPTLFLADRCNAQQLKESCMQFISINLALILENRVLDALPLDVVMELSDYYTKFHPQIRGRKIYSPANGPSEAEFEEGMENLSEELKSEIENCWSSEEVKRRAQAKTSRKPRLRSRASESEVQIQSEVQTQITILDAIPQTSTSPLKQQETPKSKAIPLKPSFRGLLTPSQTMAGLKLLEGEESSSKMKISAEFPILNKEFAEPKSKNSPSPPKGNPGKDKINNYPTLASTTLLDLGNGKIKGKIPVSPPGVMGENINSPLSLSAGGKKKTKWKKVDVNAPTPIVISAPIVPAPVPDRDPNNPWKMETTKKPVFSDIVQDEVEKKENFKRAVTKSLALMQIEDEAINQLTRRYHSRDVDEGIELLTVERVCSTNFAPPTWVQNSSFILKQ